MTRLGSFDLGVLLSFLYSFLEDKVIRPVPRDSIQKMVVPKYHRLSQLLLVAFACTKWLLVRWNSFLTPIYHHSFLVATFRKLHEKRDEMRSQWQEMLEQLPVLKKHPEKACWFFGGASHASSHVEKYLMDLFYSWDDGWTPRVERKTREREWSLHFFALSSSSALKIDCLFRVAKNDSTWLTPGFWGFKREGTERPFLEQDLVMTLRAIISGTTKKSFYRDKLPKMRWLLFLTTKKKRVSPSPWCTKLGSFNQINPTEDLSANLDLFLFGFLFRQGILISDHILAKCLKLRENGFN